MRRRGGGDFERTFSFGGRVPPASGFLLAALLALYVADLANLTASRWLALAPQLIVPGGQLWRLATWSLLSQDGITLVFAGLWIWQTGGQLAAEWGTRSFLSIWFGMTVGAGLAQAVLGWALGGSFAAPQASPWPVLVAFLLMWAMQHRGAQMSFFGVLPMTAEMLSWLIVGGTALFAIEAAARRGAGGTFVTNFAALGIAYAIAGPGLPFRRWWYRLKAELHVRRSRRRASKFKVVSRGGRDEPPRWMN